MNEENVVIFTSFILFSMIFLYLICKIAKRVWELFGTLLALFALALVWFTFLKVIRGEDFSIYTFTNTTTYEYLIYFSELASKKDYSWSEPVQKTSDPTSHIYNILSLASTVKQRWDDLYVKSDHE